MFAAWQGLGTYLGTGSLGTFCKTRRWCQPPDQARAAHWLMVQGSDLLSQSLKLGEIETPVNGR